MVQHKPRTTLEGLSMVSERRLRNIHPSLSFVVNEAGSNKDFATFGFKAVIPWLIQPGKQLKEQICAQVAALECRADIGV